MVMLPTEWEGWWRIWIAANSNEYYWFFSQLVGRKGSRIRGFRGSRVCFLKILSMPEASFQPIPNHPEVLINVYLQVSPSLRIIRLAFSIHRLSRRLFLTG